MNEDEKEYTLQCNPNDDDILDLNGAFSELGNENLIVNFLDSDNSLNFTKIDSEVDPEDDPEEPKDDKKFNNNFSIKSTKNSGLSAGAIVAIVVSCVAAVLIAAIAAILLRRSPKGKPTEQTSISNIPHSSL